MKTKKKNYPLFFCLLFVGAFCIYQLYFSSKNLLLVFTGERTHGQITNIDIPTSSQRIPNENITVTYTDSHGTTYTGTHFNAGKLQPLFFKNENVTVFYEKENPRNYIIWSTFILIHPLLYLAFIFGVLSSIYLLYFKKPTR